jgi:thiol-disulfide isomerase/thioredoxin
VLSTLPTGVGKYEASSIGHRTSDIGHPTSDPKLNFGLVDKHLGSGAGEEFPILQPAPFPVSAALSSRDKKSNPITLDTETHRSSVIGHPTPPQLSLGLNGEEGSNLAPHSRGQSTVDRGPNPPSSPSLPDTIPESHNQAVLYIELDGGPVGASYQTHLWCKIGAQRFAIESSKTIINEVSPRDFFRGMMPTSSGALDIQTGTLTNPTYLGVSSRGTMLLQPLLVFPGDSVLIRLNQHKGTVQFTGPAKKYFLVQQLLRLALENEEFTVHQVLSVSDKTKYLDRNSNRQKIEEAKDKFGRSVKVLQQGDEELNWLIEQFEKSDFPPRVRRLVKAHQEIISEDKLEKLQADVLGTYYATYAKQLKRIIPDLSAEAVPQANRFLSDLQRSLESIQKDNWGLSGIVEFWLTLADAQMETQSLDPLAWISNLSAGYPRDLLVEHYFISKGESLKNLDEELEVGLSMVDDASVLATLSQIKATRSLGTPVLPIALLTPENDTVDLANYKDQVSLVEFWLSGCGACLTRYQKAIKPLEEHFAKDSRFRMVSVSVDRNSNRWRTNIGTYSSEEATNALALPSAFTGLRQYGIDSYPAFLLLGKNGQILRVSGFPNQLDQLINLVQHALDTEFSNQSSIQQEK